MTQYAKVAVLAVKIISEKNLKSDLAWSYALAELKVSEKNCPRSAFLGLCQSGLIKGVKPNGVELNQNKNKNYALYAVELLKKRGREKSLTALELWSKVEIKDRPVSHNGQMDVVLGLWDHRLIN